MRTGVVAKKMGMSRYYTDDGFHIPVTLLQLDNCQVVSVKTAAKDGYNAVQLGCGAAKVKNVKKPQRGHFAKAKVEPKKKLVEFKVSEDALLKPGQEIAADHFVVGQFVDVVGTSKGKGFSGAMKRHGFGGLEATHGVSISHRSHGSTGQCQDPGRVFKGKKMAGQYGDVRVTTQNLEIIGTDVATGVILVNGSIPGSKGGYVLVSDASKKALAPSAPYPASIKGGKASADKVEEAPSADDEVKAEQVSAPEEVSEPVDAAEAKPGAEASAEGADKQESAESQQKDEKQQSGEVSDES